MHGLMKWHRAEMGSFRFVKISEYSRWAGFSDFHHLDGWR